MHTMTPPDTFPLLTADDVATNPRWRDCELWDGIPVVKEAAGGMSPFVTFNIGRCLGNYLVEHDIGWGGSPETGIILRRAPTRLLSPDVVFISYAKLPSLPAKGFAECVPDFVVEVRSPDQSWRENIEKCLIWISHGVSVVWLVDIIDPRVITFRPDAAPVETRPGGSVDAEPVLPGFAMTVDEVFRRMGKNRS